MGLPGLTIEHPNFRTAPNLESQVIRVLNPNTPLEVFERQGEYFRVFVDGREGFVHSDYVVPNPGGPVQPKPDPSVPPPPPPPRPAVRDGFLAAAPEFASTPLEPPEGSLLGGGGTVAWIWNQYGGLLSALSGHLGIDPAVVVATLAVESGGRAFSNGRLVIRFENHIFFGYWGRHNEARFCQHFSYDAGATWQGHHWRPDASGAWQACHFSDQAGEWEVFEFARTLDDTAAKLSISMGLTQVMGFNFETLGYATVRDMFDAFSSDARYQVIGFFDFVRRNGAVPALQNRDYATFSRIYNGPGMVAHYTGLIEAAVQRFRELQS